MLKGGVTKRGKSNLSYVSQCTSLDETLLKFFLSDIHLSFPIHGGRRINTVYNSVLTCLTHLFTFSARREDENHARKIGVFWTEADTIFKEGRSSSNGWGRAGWENGSTLSGKFTKTLKPHWRLSSPCPVTCLWYHSKCTDFVSLCYVFSQAHCLTKDIHFNWKTKL